MERFVKFIPTRGHTGHQLADLLFEFIEDNGISLKDLRGQSYDNASNMSGKYKGMQAIIKERNHQAECSIPLKEFIVNEIYLKPLPL